MNKKVYGNGNFLVNIKGRIRLTFTFIIGIAVFPADGTTYEELYKKADEASYIAKNSGKDSYSFVGFEEK